MPTDAELLREYALSRSEPAFAELVNRYVNLVYSSALRQLGGDAHLAEDVVQAVFADLARKSKKLARHTSVSGWLYTSVRFAAATARRDQQRRGQREKDAHTMSTTSSTDPDPELQWESIMPVLDQAMHSLREIDRQAILLRFFQGHTFAAVGNALGLTEEAARKRVERALERLRSRLDPGTGMPSTGLAALLAAHAASAAPAGLGLTVTKGSIAAASAATTTGAIPLVNFMSISKLKIAGTIITAGLTTVIFFQAQNASKLRKENQSLHRQILQSEQAGGELIPVRRGSSVSSLSEEQFKELMRLRGEVGVLKQQLADANKKVLNSVAPAGRQEGIPENPEEDSEIQMGILKMAHAKVWMFAFYEFAQQNNGLLPSSFQEAAATLPRALPSSNVSGEPPLDPAELQQATNHFEIVYSGALDQVAHPAKTIVLREKEARQLRNGSWVRTYAFADGHSEIHRTQDGNFVPWEQRLMQQQ